MSGNWTTCGKCGRSFMAGNVVPELCSDCDTAKRNAATIAALRTALAAAERANRELGASRDKLAKEVVAVIAQRDASAAEVGRLREQVLGLQAECIEARMVEYYGDKCPTCAGNGGWQQEHIFVFCPKCKGNRRDSGLTTIRKANDIHKYLLHASHAVQPPLTGEALTRSIFTDAEIKHHVDVIIKKVQERTGTTKEASHGDDKAP